MAVNEGGRDDAATVTRKVVMALSWPSLTVNVMSLLPDTAPPVSTMVRTPPAPEMWMLPGAITSGAELDAVTLSSSAGDSASRTVNASAGVDAPPLTLTSASAVIVGAVFTPLAPFRIALFALSAM